MASNNAAPLNSDKEIIQAIVEELVAADSRNLPKILAAVREVSNSSNRAPSAETTKVLQRPSLPPPIFPPLEVLFPVPNLSDLSDVLDVPDVPTTSSHVSASMTRFTSSGIPTKVLQRPSLPPPIFPPITDLCPFSNVSDDSYVSDVPDVPTTSGIPHHVWK